MLFPRFSAELVATALKDTPVVMVTGPSQCGKTTLVRDLVGSREFITMDDDTVLATARSDLTGLVRALDRTTIDEVQRVAAEPMIGKDLVQAVLTGGTQKCCDAEIQNDARTQIGGQIGFDDNHKEIRRHPGAVVSRSSGGTVVSEPAEAAGKDAQAAFP